MTMNSKNNRKLILAFATITLALIAFTVFLWTLYPDPSLVFSIPIRLAAFAIAVSAIIYWKDYRISFLALMFFLMAMRQFLSLLIRGGHIEKSETTRMMSEIPGFIVTILALLSIIYLWKLLVYKEKANKAEVALKHSEEKFRLFSNFSNDWEYWRDNNGKFIFLSPSFEKITGYPCDTFGHESKLMNALVHKDDFQKWDNHVKEPILETEHSPVEFRIIKKNGEVCWIHHTCRRVYNEEGKDIGTRGSNRDITVIKELKDEIKTLRDIIPICSFCKKIRTDEGIWDQLEAYFSRHTEAKFSHGVCEDCLKKHYPELDDNL